jgi:hypothetical protein
VDIVLQIPVCGLQRLLTVGMSCVMKNSFPISSSGYELWMNVQEKQGGWCCVSW